MLGIMNSPEIHLACPHCFQTVRFTRTRGSKAMGCLAYALAIPVLSVFVGMGVLALAFAGVDALGGSENLTVAVALVLGILAAISIVAWGIRSYRREVAAEVVVEFDRLRMTRGAATTTVEFKDVASVRIRELLYHGSTFEITLRNGRRVAFPSDVAPLERSLDALTRTVVTGVAGSLDARLRSGEDLVVRQSGVRSFALLAKALMAYLWTFSMLFKPWLAVGQVLHANRLVRLGIRGFGGGIRISRHEIRSAGGLPLALSWDSLKVKKDEDGLVIADERRGKLAIPASMDNFLPVVKVIENLAGR